MVNVTAWFAPMARGRALVVATVVTVGIAVFLGRQGQPLKEKVAGGILSYEFAWTAERAREIVGAWQDRLQVARRQVLFDFAFLIAYPITLALACGLLAQAPGNPMTPVGAFLAVAVLAAAPLDATENVALLRMLSHPPSNALARLAGVCAGVKFALVFASLGYLMLAGLGTVLTRWRAG